MFYRIVENNETKIQVIKICGHCAFYRDHSCLRYDIPVGNIFSCDRGFLPRILLRKPNATIKLIEYETAHIVRDNVCQESANKES